MKMPSKREQLLEIMEDAAKGETKATLRARIAELEAEVERLTKDAVKVTDAMELARAVLAQLITAGHNVPGPTPRDIENAFWALDAALEEQGGDNG